MCVDFTDLNKACPKDNYPLPWIDVLVDLVTKHQLLSFMNAFSGYNQIKLDEAYWVLSTYELMYQNSNVYCWQTMIKTSCLVLFRFAQSCALHVKLESSCCRFKCAFRPCSIDRSLDSIDRISGRMFFSVEFIKRNGSMVKRVYNS